MLLWLTINSIGILVLFMVVYLSLRQIGVLIGRLGPAGARTGESLSPRIGENITPFTGRLGLDQSSPHLLIFASEACSICKNVRAAAEVLSRHWRADVCIVMIYDESLSPGADNKPGTLAVMGDRTLRGDLGIGFVPFAVLTASGGTVLGRGLVNDASQLESLLEARQLNPTADTFRDGKNNRQNADSRG